MRCPKFFVLLLLLLLLCCFSAVAEPLDPVPQAVTKHLSQAYPDYVLEDYISIPGTKSGDYGFALIARQERRVLVGYRDSGSGLRFWMSNADAVPQGTGTTAFARHDAQDYADYGTKVYGNDRGFSVRRIAPQVEEYWMQSVDYHDVNGSFLLFTYMDRSVSHVLASVSDSGVNYYDFLAGNNLGTVKGTVQRDVRYVSFSALPKSYQAAQKKLTTAPAIPTGGLCARKIKFTGNQKFAVYSAPDATSLRGANGKAVVSTNDWIQVFGSENGYILIQYAISSQQMRIGYIDAKALPKGETVDALSWLGTSVFLTQSATLTDDPLKSENALCTLPQDTPLTLLATMGEWAYVESGSGDWVRGFVRQSALRSERVYDLSSHSEGQAVGTLIITDQRLTVDVTSSITPAYFSLQDEHGDTLATALPVKGEIGRYQAEAELPEMVTCVAFVPVYEDGTVGERAFSVEW